MGGWVKPKVKTFRFYRVFDSNKASGFRAEGEGGLAGLSSCAEVRAEDEGGGEGGVWV